MKMKKDVEFKKFFIFLGIGVLIAPSIVTAEEINKNILVITEQKLDDNASKKMIKIEIPTPPKVPTVITVDTNSQRGTTAQRDIKFSKRIPSNYLTSKERYAKGGEGAKLSHSKNMVGDVDKGRISAYLRADLMDVNTIKEKLKNAGFEVVAVAPLDEKKELISIVFSNAELKKLASKKNLGYLATLRVLIDPQNKQISITNPLYLAKAFMGESFTPEVPKKLLQTLNSTFNGVRNSMDKLKFQLLPKYQFMQGMPFYGDYDVLAHGENLKAKLKNNKQVVYSFDLPNGTTVVGVKLSATTAKFPQKIGTNNAAMLPYPLIIEDGEAKMLDPKYYLSLMYPQLTMQQFMSIMTIPKAIVTDCTKVFN